MSGTYQRNKQTFPQLHLQKLPPKYLTACTINTGADALRQASGSWP